jgi:hypothetical protein
VRAGIDDGDDENPFSASSWLNRASSGNTFRQFFIAPRSGSEPWRFSSSHAVWMLCDVVSQTGRLCLARLGARCHLDGDAQSIMHLDSHSL